MLLVDELIQLIVKSSKVVPTEKPTLIGFVWMRKTFNPDFFMHNLRVYGR